MKGACHILVPKIGAIVLVFILFFGCNMTYAQESNLENPESRKGETIDFIQTSFNKGQTRVEVDLKSSESNRSERINFIQTSFDEGETRAKLWSYSWTGLYGVLTGVQTFQALYTRHDRTSNIVGASQSLLGVAALIIDPFHARSSGRALRELSASTPEEQQHKLDIAESWLERNAKQEKFGRSWLTHVLALAVTGIGGAIIWHNDGSKSGMTSILAGIAVSEAQIWTQPTKAVTDDSEYRGKYKGGKNNIPERKYFIAPSANGFVAGVIF
jgi:hypothetical protein